MRNYLNQTLLRPGFLASLFSLTVITLLGLATLFTMNPTCAIQPSNPSGKQTVVQQDEPQSDASQEREWRYTRYGWQDANTWAQPESTQEFITVQHVHPSLLAADVVLASIGALIWATDDEFQIARLFGRVKDDNVA